MTFLLCECKKTKARLLSVLFPVLALISIWNLWAVQDPDPALLAMGYSYLTGNFVIMNLVFLPTAIAVMASRQMDLENAGNTYKLLYTLQPKTSLLHSKLLLSAGCLLLFYLAEILICLVQGSALGFTEAFPYTAYLQLAGCGLLTSLLLLLLQLYLSLRLTNQLYPLFIGLTGSFLGIFSLFAPPGSPILYLCPWSYFTLCFSSNPYLDETTDTLVLVEIPFDQTGFVLLLLATILAYLLVRRSFLKKEV